MKSHVELLVLIDFPLYMKLEIMPLAILDSCTFSTSNKIQQTKLVESNKYENKNPIWYLGLLKVAVQ